MCASREVREFFADQTVLQSTVASGMGRNRKRGQLFLIESCRISAWGTCWQLNDRRDLMKSDRKQSIFKSFWRAGFEGANHVNGSGHPLTMKAATAHGKTSKEAYVRLCEFEKRTLRESVGWRGAKRNGRFPYSAVELRARAVRQCKVEVVWALSHFGVPPDILQECLLGAIEAGCGTLQAALRAADASSHQAQRPAANATACKAESITHCCSDGVAGAETELVAVDENDKRQDDEAENFEQFIYRVWDKGVSKHFAIPYNKSCGRFPLPEMETFGLGARVPMRDLEAKIAGALGPVPPMTRTRVSGMRRRVAQASGRRACPLCPFPACLKCTTYDN